LTTILPTYIKASVSNRTAACSFRSWSEAARRRPPCSTGEITIAHALKARRSLLTAVAATAATGLITPLRAQGHAPTPTMRRGANNYLAGAPIVQRIGGGDFWMTGTVRRAGDGAPLPRLRIQIGAHTTEGHERDPHSHGATLTDADGVFSMEMPQIVPAFGQAHRISPMAPPTTKMASRRCSFGQ
jgi:hypothetical protein